MSAFANTLKTFCDELRLTFPELVDPITRALKTTPSQFWKSWVSGLDILLLRDSAKLFDERKGFIVGAVRLTPAIWSEISENTRAAIWKYLRTLTLESVLEPGASGAEPLKGLDTETTQKLMNILTASLDADEATAEIFEESMNHMKPLLEKLKGMLGSLPAGFMDASGFAMPEIPERLRNGRIAKMAEEMAKQFDPSDFGIDPALLTGDNVEEIFKRLAELYQRDPTCLIAGAKRMADRIKTQIMGGSLNRDELVAEAQEFIEIFKEHPMFKEIMSKVNGLVGPGGIAEMFGSSSNAGAPSERRRAVQERLRKKMAARKK